MHPAAGHGARGRTHDGRGGPHNNTLTVWAQAGPTKDEQPVFCWNTTHFPNPHHMHPDCFNHSWAALAPLLLFLLRDHARRPRGDDSSGLSDILALKLGSARALARERGARWREHHGDDAAARGGLRRRWHHRSDVDLAVAAPAEALYERRRAPRASAEAGFFDGGCKTNNERGRGCSGQGKRHRNPAIRAQPVKGGGRLAKWSNPNPKSSKPKKKS